MMNRSKIQVLVVNHPIKNRTKLYDSIAVQKEIVSLGVHIIYDIQGEYVCDKCQIPAGASFACVPCWYQKVKGWPRIARK